MATNNTSGTYDFNLEIGDVIQEATEMIGGVAESYTSYTPIESK